MLSEAATKKQITEHGIKKDPRTLIESSQAVNADYERTGYDRGHLSPVCHQADKNEQDATFTLTNVVPMNANFNRGKWKSYELHMIKYAKECTTMYVVTGIVPGDKWINRTNTDRVNIPSHVWNAYCCVDNNGKPIKSGAGIGENIMSTNDVSQIGIDDLQKKLKNSLGNIEIFQNNCMKF
ncbi:hypothetical protein XELAEV_18018853mg [Xenopus laevis]|nr:hypothetical protein XELAEV_18018853mg [Xenopus laevis]